MFRKMIEKIDDTFFFRICLVQTQSIPGRPTNAAKYSFSFT